MPNQLKIGETYEINGVQLKDGENTVEVDAIGKLTMNTKYRIRFYLIRTKYRSDNKWTYYNSGVILDFFGKEKVVNLSKKIRQLGKTELDEILEKQVDGVNEWFSGININQQRQTNSSC